MNTRLFYVVLAVQTFFAAALIIIGLISRDNRRAEYLDQTRRITSGQASSDEYAKLSSRILGADALHVRAQCGPPMQRATEIEVGSPNPEHRTGTFWIYYPADASGYPLDFEAMEKLSGPVSCFVVSFENKRAEAQVLTVMHPVKGK